MQVSDERHLLPTEYSPKQSILIYWKRFLLVLTIALGNLLALVVFVVFRDVIEIAILLLLVVGISLALIRRRSLTWFAEKYKLRLMNHKPYWRMHSVFRAAEFQKARRTFRMKEYFLGARTGIRILLRLLRLSIGASLLGVVIAAAMLLVAHNNQESTDEVTNWLWRNIATLSESSYDVALIAILTIAGVVLTLYFSNLNTLVGSLYSEMPERIRALLWQDRASHISLKVISTLVIYSLITLAGGTILGLRPNASMLLAVAWIIFAFPTVAFLARRTFALFDPTYLADYAIKDLDIQSQSVTHVQSEPVHEAVQHHRMELASGAVTELQTFSEIAVRQENLRDDALIRLFVIMFDFIPSYLPRKRRIPLESGWYRRVPEHKDWYLTPDVEVSTATVTYTSLQPKWVPDHEWLEHRFMSFLESTFERLVRESNYTLAYQILNVSQIAFEALGAGFQIQSASQSLSALSKVLMREDTFGETSESNVDHLEELQTLTHLINLPITILLSFSKELRVLNVADLVRTVKRIKWEKNTSIYKSEIPFFMLSNIEYLQHRLRFEFTVEGRIVSAEWYIIQLGVVHPVADMLQSQLRELIRLGEEIYTSNLGQLIESGRGAAATLIIGSGLEYFHKLTHHSEQIFETMKAIESYRIEKDIAFAEIDAGNTNQRITDLKHQLIKSLAQCVPQLTKDEVFLSNKTPDLLGQALNTLGEEYFSALSSNEVDLTSSVFPAYFAGSLAKRKLLVKMTSEYQDPASIIVHTSQPIMELLALSGYAFLFSEYYRETGLWESCKSVWAFYLAKSEFADYLCALFHMIDQEKWMFFSSPRFARRRWEQKFRDRMRMVPLVPLEKESDRAFYRAQVRRHSSIVIRALLGDENFAGIMVHDPIDVFVSLYLRDKLPISNLDRNYYRDISERIGDQKEREERHGFCIDDWEDSGQDD